MQAMSRKQFTSVSNQWPVKKTVIDAANMQDIENKDLLPEARLQVRNLREVHEGAGRVLLPWWYGRIHSQPLDLYVQQKLLLNSNPKS